MDRTRARNVQPGRSRAQSPQEVETMDLLLEVLRCDWVWVREWWDPFGWLGTGHYVQRCFTLVDLGPR